MGYYFGTATRFKVAKSAPLPVLEFIDKFFIDLDCSGAFGKLKAERVGTPGTALAAPIPEDMIDDMDYMPFMLGGDNAYFSNWWWRVKEDHGDHWLYETRGSCKSPRYEFLSKVFEWIGPGLVVNDGDILFRLIGEDDAKEHIFYWDNGKVIQRLGFDYYNYLPDGTKGDGYDYHPSCQKESREFDFLSGEPRDRGRSMRHSEWLPGWTCREIDQLMGKALCEEIADLTAFEAPVNSKRNKSCKNPFRPGLNKPKKKKSR